MATSRPPVAFLSHSSKDAALAEQIATALVANGVDTFYSDWSIVDGDSLVKKVEQGLEDCTHFLVLLTPESLASNWVQTEIDAGLVKAIEGQCRFISLLYGVSHGDLTPILKTKKHRT